MLREESVPRNTGVRRARLCGLFRRLTSGAFPLFGSGERVFPLLRRDARERSPNIAGWEYVREIAEPACRDRRGFWRRAKLRRRNDQCDGRSKAVAGAALGPEIGETVRMARRNRVREQREVRQVYAQLQPHRLRTGWRVHAKNEARGGEGRWSWVCVFSRATVRWLQK